MALNDATFLILKFSLTVSGLALPACVAVLCVIGTNELFVDKWRDWGSLRAADQCTNDRKRREQ